MSDWWRKNQRKIDEDKAKSQEEYRQLLELGNQLNRKPDNLSMSNQEMTQGLYEEIKTSYANNTNWLKGQYTYEDPAQSPGGDIIPDYFFDKDLYGRRSVPPFAMRRREKKVKDAVFGTLVLTVDGVEHEVIWFDGELLPDVLERMAQSMR